ncbi:hypothetical protein ANAPH1_00364 [Anaplasma phagocytophilum]|nr:hypothetical protein ANAPH1_00364 [Anaplasma phagocytophilum]
MPTNNPSVSILMYCPIIETLTAATSAFFLSTIMTHSMPETGLSLDTPLKPCDADISFCNTLAAFCTKTGSSALKLISNCFLTLGFILYCAISKNTPFMSFKRVSIFLSTLEDFARKYQFTNSTCITPNTSLLLEALLSLNRV